MNELIELSIKGTREEEGEFGGSGELTINFNDITKSSVVFDYSDPDKVILKLDSSVGFSVSAENTLTFSGGLDYNFINQEFGGRIGAKFTISKEIAVQIEQAFAKDKNKTTLTLTIKL